MRHARVLLAACALLAALPAAAQEAPLGRLFFTPEQRAALDARRKARVPDKPAAVPVESPVTRIDGAVRRSGGRSTVFVNGEAVPEGTAAAGGGEGASLSRGGRVRLGAGEGDAPRELRVGESLDRASGEVRDVVGADAIRTDSPRKGTRK